MFGLRFSWDVGGAAVDAQVDTVERNTSVSDCLRYRSLFGLVRLFASISVNS